MEKSPREVHLALVREYGAGFGHLIPDEGTAGSLASPGDSLLGLARINPLEALQQAENDARYLAKDVRNHIHMIWAESDPFAALAHFEQHPPGATSQNCFSKEVTKNYLSAMAFFRDPEKFKSAGMTVEANFQRGLPPAQFDLLGAEVVRSKDMLLEANPDLAKSLIGQYGYNLAKSIAPDLSVADIASVSERYGISKQLLCNEVGWRAAAMGDTAALAALFKSSDEMGQSLLLRNLSSKPLTLLTPEQIETIIGQQETPDKQQQLRTAFEAQLAERSPYEVYAATGGATYSPEAKAAALQKLADTDPETALEWMARPGSPLEGSTPESYQRLYSSLARRDPEGALQSTDRLADPKLQQSMREEVLQTWIKNNPWECSEYLNTTTDNSLRDVGAGVLATAVVKEDPEAALIWWQSIHSPETRAAALKRMDPEALGTLMATESYGTLTEEQKREIQTWVPSLP